MKMLNKIIKLISPYKNKAFLSILLSFLGTIFALFSFAMIKPFLEILFETIPLVHEPVPFEFSTEALMHNFNYTLSKILINSGHQMALVFICLFIIGLVFFKTLFWYLSKITLIPLRTNVLRDMRNKLNQKILELQLAFFSEEKKGDIISRMSNDVQEIDNTIVVSINNALKAPITIIVYLTTLFIISPFLTLFVLVILPLSGALIGRIGKSLRKKSLKSQNKLGQLLSYIDETLFGLRIIKAFNTEEKIHNRFSRENQSYTSLMNRIWGRRELASPLSEMLSTVAIVIVIWYGGNMVLGEEITLSPQGFITYLVIFSQIIQPAKDLSTVYYNVQKGLASIERIEHLLHSENAIFDKPNAKSLNAFTSHIEYQNVNFRYIEDYVLKDINAKIEKGKTIALVGQSGSGKSTMVDLLPRFYDVEEGEILLDNIPIKDIKIKDLRHLMGIVSQESVLFNDTIYNNIALGKNNASEEEIIQAAKIANAHDFILQTENGYETNIGDRGSKLSGGQRQRLSIARAVLKNPPILILDEATSALDTESEKLVQDAINKLMKNRTSIVIAHRLSTIKDADEILVLQNGEIVERGQHEQLIQLKGVYKKLYELQSFS